MPGSIKESRGWKGALNRVGGRGQPPGGRDEMGSHLLAGPFLLLTHNPWGAGEAASSLSSPLHPPPSGLSHWGGAAGKRFPLPGFDLTPKVLDRDCVRGLRKPHSLPASRRLIPYWPEVPEKLPPRLSWDWSPSVPLPDCLCLLALLQAPWMGFKVSVTLSTPCFSSGKGATNFRVGKFFP